jgi:hypothetical protein
MDYLKISVTHYREQDLFQNNQENIKSPANHLAHKNLCHRR